MREEELLPTSDGMVERSISFLNRPLRVHFTFCYLRSLKSDLLTLARQKTLARLFLDGEIHVKILSLGKM